MGEGLGFAGVRGREGAGRDWGSQGQWGSGEGLESEGGNGGSREGGVGCGGMVRRGAAGVVGEEARRREGREGGSFEDRYC